MQGDLDSKKGKGVIAENEFKHTKQKNNEQKIQRYIFTRADLACKQFFQPLSTGRFDYLARRQHVASGAAKEG